MVEGDKSLRSLVNVGAVIAKALVAIGIKSKEDFLKQDPYKIFHKLKRRDPSLCRCVLASIIGAHEGLKWHRITKEAAKEYQRRYPDAQWKNKC